MTTIACSTLSFLHSLPARGRNSAAPIGKDRFPVSATAQTRSRVSLCRHACSRRGLQTRAGSGETLPLDSPPPAYVYDANYVPSAMDTSMLQSELIVLGTVAVMTAYWWYVLVRGAGDEPPSVPPLHRRRRVVVVFFRFPTHLYSLPSILYS